jgi:hypothetical protein
LYNFASFVVVAVAVVVVVVEVIYEIQDFVENIDEVMVGNVMIYHTVDFVLELIDYMGYFGHMVELHHSLIELNCMELELIEQLLQNLEDL